VRIVIRVRPGTGHPGVGGEHDAALIVRVSFCEQAVDGKGTVASLAAVAAAFGVGRDSVSLVAGSAKPGEYTRGGGRGSGEAQMAARTIGLPGCGPHH
jgi:uncharacterized protein